ncbi:MAG: hypothetical protein HYY16_14535 [Planctomycetes bacterium]|nr:hypothetical protein [Planctomycetota bacterium]
MKRNPTIALLATSAWLLTNGCSSPRGPQEPAPAEGKAVKITYIRFNLDPRTRLNRHEYRILVSEGWRSKHGAPRDAFAKLYRDPFQGTVPDAVMMQLLEEMRRRGFEELRETSLRAIDPRTLAKVEKSPDEELGKKWRIIHVETDDFQKTVTFADNDDRLLGTPGKDQLAFKFGKVETEVLKVAFLYTALVSYEAPPMIPK